MFKLKRILVPTDFSEYSDKALGRALDIAKEQGAEIILFHVIHVDFHTCVVDYCLTVAEMEAVTSRIQAAAENNAQEQLGKFPLSKEVPVSIEIRSGVPYEEILKLQQERAADLIVIASHGRSGLMTYLMGSVASKVIKLATCEVFLVK